MDNAKLEIIHTLRSLLQKQRLRTQEEIKQQLQQLGFSINQTKVSRLLRQLGAVKVEEADGVLCYRLPTQTEAPAVKHSLAELILTIEANETIVVIRTQPGSANLIASIIDYQQSNEILGTIAGDDTILVIPRSTKRLQQTINLIKDLIS